MRSRFVVVVIDSRVVFGFVVVANAKRLVVPAISSHNQQHLCVSFPQNVGREVLAVTLVATFVMLWNMLTGEYTDLTGGVHPGILRGQYTPVLALPMNPFTLSSSFLGLLLVFRTNKAYQRWDEARKNWGMNM